MALKARELAYKKGFFKTKKAPSFVLSIGNLTLGGSGKTPITMLLAQWAKEKGYRVAVISRGYKGNKSSKKPIVVSDGKRVYLGPKEVGDEPYMMAKKLKDVPILISKSRFNACVLAKEIFDTEVSILDDGFQHLALYRNLNLLMLTPNTFQDELFPLGNLREPIGSITRADVLLVVLDELKTLDHISLPFLFNGPIFIARQLPHKVYLAKEAKELALSFLKGKDLIAFTGIAQPDRFLNTLFHLKANVIKFYRFKDHHYFRPKDIQKIKQELEKGLYLITTEKDWARLEELSYLFGPELLVLSTHIEVERAEKFFALIERAILGGVKDKRSLA